MIDYKKEVVSLGQSDIASLTVVGCTTDGVVAKILNMGGDGSYSAYIVRNPKSLLPDHYRAVMQFRCFTQFYNHDGSRGEVVAMNTWVKIFDDSSLVAEFDAKEISILRAGDYGIMIVLED